MFAVRSELAVFTHCLDIRTSGFKTLNKTFNLADGYQVTLFYIAGDLNIQSVLHDHV